MGYVLLCWGLASTMTAGAPGVDDWVTVQPEEFEGAINNPLKGFRGYYSDMSVRITVRKTGSAPFYLNWPVAVALLDLQHRKPLWSAPLKGIDVREWLPEENWDSEFRFNAPEEMGLGIRLVTPIAVVSCESRREQRHLR